MFLYLLAVPISFSIVYLVWRYFIRVLLELNYYKKQGLLVQFKSVFDPFKDDIINTEKFKDFFYDWKSIANMENKPPAFAYNMGKDVVLCLQDPDHIKQFFTNFEYYEKSDACILVKDLLYSGLLTTEGKIWKKHRKIVSMAFNYKIIESITPKIVQICNEFMRNYKQRIYSRFNAMNEWQALTAEIIVILFFGEKISSHELEGKTPTVYLNELIGLQGDISAEASFLLFGMKLLNLGIMKSHAEYLRRRDTLKNFCKRIVHRKFEEISQNLSNGKNESEVNLIKMFYDFNNAKGSDLNLSEEEIIDEFFTFFAAGMDTTAHTLTMITYFICKNSHVHQLLMQEIQNLVPGSNDFTLENLNKMDYMTAVIKESLRMGTPSANILDRVSLQDHLIGNIKVKKGTLINVSFIGNNFDHRYHEEPEKFLPERWLDKKSRTFQSLLKNPMIFTPFSIGGRNCIGQHLAMIEMKIILSIFLKNFGYELSDPNYILKMNGLFQYEPLVPIEYNLKIRDS